MRISDWSSDVCSSDLRGLCIHGIELAVSFAHDTAYAQGLAQRMIGKARADQHHGNLKTPCSRKQIRPDLALDQYARAWLVMIDKATCATRKIVRQPLLPQPSLGNGRRKGALPLRSEEHTSELQSLMPISY